jgi:hypothetical protein
MFLYLDSIDNSNWQYASNEMHPIQLYMRKTVRVLILMCICTRQIVDLDAAGQWTQAKPSVVSRHSCTDRGQHRAGGQDCSFCKLGIPLAITITITTTAYSRCQCHTQL